MIATPTNEQDDPNPTPSDIRSTPSATLNRVTKSGFVRYQKRRVSGGAPRDPADHEGLADGNAKQPIRTIFQTSRV